MSTKKSCSKCANSAKYLVEGTYYCGRCVPRAKKTQETLISEQPAAAADTGRTMGVARPARSSCIPRDDETDDDLGQFMTTNPEEILANFKIPDTFTGVIIEPFAGEGHLVSYYGLQQDRRECYDIDPKKDFIVKRDVFMEPPSFAGKYVVTNPPYRAKNKSANKDVFNRYGENDLYKCFIRMLIMDPCEGGILILPVNFLLSSGLLRDFLQVYKMPKIDVFETRVFNDTSSAVCSLQFEKRAINERPVGDFAVRPGEAISITFYPCNETVPFIPCVENNYVVGGEIYNLPVSGRYRVSRGNSKFVVKCIDDSATSRIRADVMDEVRVVEKPSERSYLPIVIEPPVGINVERALADRFNAYLNDMRDRYRSMFLTSYREGVRKRITFDLAYLIIGYLLDKMNVPVIVPSRLQTSQWRIDNLCGGDIENLKRNVCENNQKQLIAHITGIDLAILERKTSMRFNIKTFELIKYATPIGGDKFEWTEDMDCKYEYGEHTIFFNLKYISDRGGSQNRAMKETYHLILCQIAYLKKYPNRPHAFINILDGAECSRNIENFRYALRDEPDDILSNIFIGDMSEFQEHWQTNIAPERPPAQHTGQ